MANISIRRTHTLAPSALKALTDRWLHDAQSRFGLSCERQQRGDADTISFSRPGVSGRVTPTPTELTLEAQLGFLLSAYSNRIETEIQRKLDEALGLAAGASHTPPST